ncbi:MAG: NAD(P)/FAD-dependent oxidoreductase [Verrucomicrobiota bacterium]
MKIHQRNLPRVVIIGGGFGGLEAAKELSQFDVRITLLDRQNHHLFQPLLYQVATAALSPADIAEPLRHVLRKHENVEVLMTIVERIDPGAKKVITSEGEIVYDYLIVAAGARHSYFGHPEWEKFAPGLKSLEDAVEIRQRMLLAFEIAEKTLNDALRRSAMTFVVIGAGPTGVEMAGAIAEIARVTLVSDFRHIDPAQARVILLDAAPRILPTFDPELSASAQKQLEALGVTVRLQAAVEEVSAEGITLKGGEFVAAHTLVWAAGNAASPLGASLGVPVDRQGRVIVNADLTIPGHRETMVIGDLAHFELEDGSVLPGVSPVAMQQGRHAANNIWKMIVGGWPERFHYTDKGMMATIGRHSAVADIASVRFSGYPAWLAWLFIHLIFLVGFRNKIVVLFSWAYAHLFFGRGARLIVRYARPAPPL